MRHDVVVYRRPGRFGGWPANHGIWSWGDEILVGFSSGYMKTEQYRFHAIDDEKPESHLLARSLDGGETWHTENPADRGPWIGAMLGRRNYPDEPEWTNLDVPIDFADDQFAMTVRNKAINGPWPSRFYISYDRGELWSGPFRLPLMDQSGVAARTDYLVKSRTCCQLFLTAMKRNDREGRPFVAQTNDGGLSWSFVSWICDVEENGFAIMPSTVCIGDGDLVTAIRKKGGRSNSHGRHWIDIHRSFDGGKTWGLGSAVVSDSGKGGNPGHLLRLRDGRLVLTWAYRRTPYSIRATISEDEGRTWNRTLPLRSQQPSENNSHDIGYTRSVQRNDGKIVTVYYWCDDVLSERYIAATIWSV